MAALKPYASNPFYWEWDGKPVILLGSSSEDNLFQVEHFASELRRLARSGGNYVRCTMSSRDRDNVWPFSKLDSGLYDLTRPGEEYWRRFREFLAECRANRIVAQIEVWDRFDFAREPWSANPFNPKNNVNYDAAESGLREAIESHPGACENDFFHTVPALRNNEVVLEHQRRFVNWLLEVTREYDSVLYCMDNETNDDPEWGWYWANYIAERAQEAGTVVHQTEMWDAHDLTSAEHRNTIDHPELFSFLDISQNNHRPADRHWENAVRMREIVAASDTIRPLNSVKIYGSNDGRYGSRRDAEERFWRNIFAGLASSRFHRPPAGIGASPLSLRHVMSMRMFAEVYPFYAGAPAREVLLNNSWNEAYCNATDDGRFAVFFTDGGHVQLAVSEGARYSLKWLEIDACRWHPVRHEHETNGEIHLITPTDAGYWAVVVEPV